MLPLSCGRVIHINIVETLSEKSKMYYLDKLTTNHQIEIMASKPDRKLGRSNSGSTGAILAPTDLRSGEILVQYSTLDCMISKQCDREKLPKG